MVVCTYSLFSRLEWHTPLTSTLVMEVRLPRMLLALFAGMGLTIAGQMFQIILNNPLADSFTLGLANGATVGAAIAVLLGLPFVWVAPLAMALISRCYDYRLYHFEGLSDAIAHSSRDTHRFVVECSAVFTRPIQSAKTPKYCGVHVRWVWCYGISRSGRGDERLCHYYIDLLHVSSES